MYETKYFFYRDADAIFICIRLETVEKRKNLTIQITQIISYFGKVGKLVVSEEVSPQLLIKTKYTPMLLYGLVVCPLNNI